MAAGSSARRGRDNGSMWQVWEGGACGAGHEEGGLRSEQKREQILWN